MLDYILCECFTSNLLTLFYISSVPVNSCLQVGGIDIATQHT